MDVAAAITLRAIQLNPNNPAYWLSRGFTGKPLEWIEIISQTTKMTAFAVVNRANQLNPNNPLYWLSRGFSERPPNWQELVSTHKYITIVPSWGQYLNQTLVTCGHGLHKAVCWLCTWKGLLFLGTTIAVGVISYHLYLRHKEQIHHYANNIPLYYNNARSSIVSNMAVLPGYYSSTKDTVTNSYLWRNGVVTPYNYTATGVMYTAGGLYNLARSVGYYCGINAPKDSKPESD